jgi:hypothetical protein
VNKERNYEIPIRFRVVSGTIAVASGDLWEQHGSLGIEAQSNNPFRVSNSAGDSL